MVLKSNVDNNLGLTICQATSEDTRTVSSILAKSFYDFPDFVGWVYPFLQFTINEDLRYRLRSQMPLYNCLVAKLSKLDGREARQDESEAIVGTAEIALRSASFWSNEPQYPYISNLAVKPDLRRLGIGSQLLAKCEQIALEWGYSEICLHVLDKNNSAKQLYDRNGYKIAQIETNWGNLWFDRSPRLLLKKQININ
jgi:ribosomal protein S18 acetylase RimI-like enzyme